jgi:hypothetical protein
MSSWERRTLASALVASLALSCSGDPPSGAGAGGAAAGGAGGSVAAGNGGAAGGGTAGGTGTATVTWADDVAALVFRECAGCHREGGIAPFSLTSYADAKPFSRAMMIATAERYMPPMPVDNSGECNTYSNARWLTDEEILLIAEWHEQGAVEGDPTRTPLPPIVPAGLERADLTIGPGAEYTPNAATLDDYRCFVVDPGLAEDSYLVAYEFVPGDPRIVHHAILFQPAEDADAADAEALDAAEEGLGYTCFGAPRVESTPLALWAPGGGATRFPAGTGVFLFERRKLVLQVHYNTGLGVFPDLTKVKLQIEPRVDRQAFYQPVADQDMNVAPGQELGMTSRTHELTDEMSAPMTIYGVGPHMHLLGRTLRLEAEFEGADESRCLTEVKKWNFHWQGGWWYDAPIKGTPTTVTISCGYDTRSRTTPVTWGEGTNDEMCLAYLYLTIP